jgi:pimeloyl-ACP methyl ester carboxylesterase
MVQPRFGGFDGAGIAVVEIGEGRPIILLHGLFSSGEMNWRRYGAAAEIAGRPPPPVELYCTPPSGIVHLWM